MKSSYCIVTFLILAAASNLTSRVEAVDLYANGFISAAGPTQYQGIWDQAGVGSGGANVSVVQPPNTIFGFSGASNFNNSLADDFTVGAGQTWTVNSLRFYAYQSFTPTFPALLANVSLTGSDPNGAVLESASGVSVNQGPGGLVAYRVTPTTLTNTDRRIWEIEVPLATAWTIPSGNYFLRWSISVASGNLFFPPIVPTNGGGNGQQSLSGGAFAPVPDTGSGVIVEFPFLLVGTVVPEPSTVILSGIAGVFAIVAVRKKRQAR